MLDFPNPSSRRLDLFYGKAQLSRMKVAKKSPKNIRRTLTLNKSSVRLIEKLRGDKPKSVFIGELIEAEARRRQQKEFYAAAAAAYTPKVAKETLKLNEEFPISEK